MKLDFLLEAKLIILYMLNKVNFPLTNAQIMDYMLDREHTNFFNLQQSFSELFEAGLISIDTTLNATLYTLTLSGKETLDYFTYKISPEIITDINTYLKDNRYELKEEVSILSSYYQATNKDYIVNCKIMEGTSLLLEINLSVATIEQAEAICKSWKLNSEDTYSYLIEKLMK